MFESSLSDIAVLTCRHVTCQLCAALILSSVHMLVKQYRLWPNTVYRDVHIVLPPTPTRHRRLMKVQQVGHANRGGELADNRHHLLLVRHRELIAAAPLGEPKEVATNGFFWRRVHASWKNAQAHTVAHGITWSDKKQRHPRCSDNSGQFPKLVGARIIASIRQYQESAVGVLCHLHRVQRNVNGVYNLNPA